MMIQPSVAVGGTETEYRCRCGQTTPESELDEWDVQHDRDRVVRVCHDCGESIPEWGCLTPIDAVARVAYGQLAASLAEQGVDVVERRSTDR